MAATSKIEWTDATWNPVRAIGMAGAKPGVTAARLAETVRPGWHCEHVSEGCRNCYAEGFNRRLGTGRDYKPGVLAPRGPVEVFLDETMLLAPLRWKKPRRIFAGSMTDLFGLWVSDAMLDRIFAVMALASQHTFQLLTKRPERAREYLTTVTVARLIAASADMPGQAVPVPEWPLPNVWLGTSVEDQPAAGRVFDLAMTPAAVRFTSSEPLIGAVDYTAIPLPADWPRCDCTDHAPTFNAFEGTIYCEGCCEGAERMDVGTLDWVIVGGESGKGARPMHPDWARSLRDQCAAAGVPFHFKQWGEWVASGQHMRGVILNLSQATASHPRFPTTWLENPPAAGKMLLARVGKRAAGRLLDGVQHDGFPA